MSLLELYLFYKVVQALDRPVSPGFARFLAVLVIGLCLAGLIVWATSEPPHVAIVRMKQQYSGTAPQPPGRAPIR
jgi:hypothetical protein